MAAEHLDTDRIQQILAGGIERLASEIENRNGQKRIDFIEAVLRFGVNRAIAAGLRLTIEETKEEMASGITEPSGTLHPEEAALS